MQAAEEGRQCKPSKWTDDLQADAYGPCVTAAIESVSNYPYRDRLCALEKYMDVMCEETQKVNCFYEMATVMNQEGCAALASKDFVQALQAFRDCYRPIQECFRLSKGQGEIFSEVSVLEIEISYHSATAEAIQAIKVGKCLFIFGLFF